MGKQAVKRKPRKKAETLPAVIRSTEPMRVDVDPQALIATAINGKASIDVIERLLAMRDKLNAENAEREFREALSGFQAECPVVPKKRIVKDKDGKQRYRYASLDDIIRVVKPYIKKFELSYDIDTIPGDGFLTAEVTAKHKAGGGKKTHFTITNDTSQYMTDIQRAGSTQTYAKRIAFCNAFGILTGDEDNDGRIDSETEKKKHEAEEKANALLEALPDNIKQGFNHLDYKKRAIWRFCEDRKWNNELILKDINKIIDQRDHK